MFITKHCIKTWYKRWRYFSWAIILIITYMKIWYHEPIILLIKPSCLQQCIPKIFHFTKIFSQIKQNYTKTEHCSAVKRIGVICKEHKFMNFIFITSLWHILVFNSLSLIIVPSTLKADLSNSQRLGSLFYLMF